MMLYIGIGVIIFMFLGWFVSAVKFEPIKELGGFADPGSAAHLAYIQYQHELLWRRVILVVIFVVSSYFLTEFALRSIQKSVRLQYRFFGTVSHELRTPLTVMKNMAEVALRVPEKLTTDKAERVLQSMLEETDRMSSTLNFLLAISSLSIQRTIPDRHEVALGALSNEVLASFADEAKTVGITLRADFTEECVVRGNTAALRGLISNLITNALRHTERGGEVTLSLSSIKKHAKLVIADTGRGISAKELPYIFEPFYQGEHRRLPESTEGMGLGLTIVREVVRLHKATIHVTSKEGVGTVFTIIFPNS